MRITIVTDRYAPEARAAAYLSRELAQGLAGLGHEIEVITRMPTQYVPEHDGPTPRETERAGGVTVKRVKAFSGSSNIWLRALDQVTVSLKILLILSTTPKSDVLLVYSPPLLFTMAAIVQKLVRGWPYVLNLHDLYPQTAIDLGILKNRLLIWIAKVSESIVYRNADRIVVAAPASYRILTGSPNCIPSSRIEMIFNYIDTKACTLGPAENAFREKHSINGRFVVLYAGLMGLAQDLTSIIEAARRLQDEPEWMFVLAGDGACLPKWTALTRELKNVLIVRPLPYLQYYEALQAADICLIPLSAAFKAPAVPGKLPAIMAAGRPIVASVPPWNDTREILAAACSGISVAPDDPEELLRALKKLKEDPELRGELGMNGARYAAAHFDTQLAVKKFERILQEVNEPTQVSPNTHRPETVTLDHWRQ